MYIIVWCKFLLFFSRTKVTNILHGKTRCKPNLTHATTHEWKGDTRHESHGRSHDGDPPAETSPDSTRRDKETRDTDGNIWHLVPAIEENVSSLTFEHRPRGRSDRNGSIRFRENDVPVAKIRIAASHRVIALVGAGIYGSGRGLFPAPDGILRRAQNTALNASTK